MRKDAKIGFAVGGVLLAVLTVYAFVVPKKKTLAPNAVSLTTPRDGASSDGAAQLRTGAEPDPVLTRTTGADNPATPGSTENPASQSKSDTPLARGGDSVNWAKLLSGAAEAPALMSTTPAPGEPSLPGPASDTPPAPAAGKTTLAAHTEHQDPASPSQGSSAVSEPPAMIATTIVPSHTSTASPATRPAGRQYVIKTGQTLSSVAGEVYGNQRFYVAILRANPGLDPARLKPGMRISLPDISDVRPDMAAAVTSQRSPAHETPEKISVASGSHTYKVESGDNLFRIAKKLFNSPKLADEIYKLNEAEIGPDKSRLKLGMVLKLPDAPTVGATASR